MGAPGLSAAADETWGAAPDNGATGLENIRVNSPGPDCAAGAPAPDCAMGAPGLDSETGESGAGEGETGLLASGGAATDSPDALAPIELNMRVNAPGPDCDVGAPGPGCTVGIPGLDSEA